MQGQKLSLVATNFLLETEQNQPSTKGWDCGKLSDSHGFRVLDPADL
jgi:hypothetical protein